MERIIKQFQAVDIDHVLAQLAHNQEMQSRCVVLDSCHFDDENERTYICVNPVKTYTLWPDESVYLEQECIGRGKTFLYEMMRKDLQHYALETDESGFVGGFIGYVSYDATPLFLGVPIKQTNHDMPVISFRLYLDVLLITQKGAQISSLSGRLSPELIELVDACQQTGAQSKQSFSDVMENEDAYVSSLSEYAFGEAVQNTQAEIESGNVYQLNLTRKLSRTLPNTKEDSFLMAYYRQVRQRNKAPYSAFYGGVEDEIQFASSSPEQFFKIRGKTMTTKPIKGTRPRKNDRAKDNAMRLELEQSTKDRAELLMITDLLRNDLNCVVDNQSVEVEKYAEVTENPTVFHLVSTINATLPENKDALDVLDGLFPGGSITGAPKKAAVSMIDQFETCPRGLYTGTLGYISVNGDADFNIIIRTLFQKHDTIEVHVGGGIVYESIPHLEFLETKQKAKALLAVIEEALK